MSTHGVLLLTAVVARTVIVFVALTIGLRLTGKRQTGELTTNDLVVVLMTANAVQNSMTFGIGRLSIALASSTTLIVLSWLLAVLVERRPAWHAHLSGVPVVLVHDGQIIDSNMRGEGVLADTLMAAVRDVGIKDLGAVRLAILEADGAISVIPAQRHRAS